MESIDCKGFVYLQDRCRQLQWLSRSLQEYAGVLERSRKWGIERGIYPDQGENDNFRSRYDKALWHVPTDGLVLDMGCGSGYGSAILAQKASHVYGIDIDADALAFGRLRYTKQNMSLLQQDVRNLLFRSNTFDVVAQMENLEHVEHPELCVHEAWRVLKPRGYYILTVPFEEVSPESPFHLTHFSFARFRFLLETYFELIELKETEFQKYLAVARKRRQPPRGVDDDWLAANDELRMDAFHPHFRFDRRLFHLDRYAFAAERFKGLRVLDVACGTGYGARLMRLRGAAAVVGIDDDPQSIDYARRCHALDANRFEVADAGCLPQSPEPFDAAVSFETIEHLPDDKGLLDGLRRSVRPGGHVIVSTPNNWPLTKHHLRTYDYQGLRNLLGAYFTVEAVFNQNSGSAWEPNQGQPRGIVPTTDQNHATAECFLFVLRVPGAGS